MSVWAYFPEEPSKREWTTQSEEFGGTPRIQKTQIMKQGSEELEALQFGGAGELLVQRHERQSRGIVLRQDDRGRELQGIGCAEGVEPKDSHRLIADSLERRNLGPFPGSFAQPLPGDH